MKYHLLFWLLIGALSVGSLHAVEWERAIKVCPNCKAANHFKKASFTAHSVQQVYHRPSKLEYVFWPHTDSEALYSCKDCGLTLFMVDFYHLPEKVLPKLRKELPQIILPQADEYLDIPITQRLMAAEQIYQLLDKDLLFWCEFYRVKGYHFAREARSLERELQHQKQELRNKQQSTQKKSEISGVLLLASAVLRPLLKFLAAENVALSVNKIRLNKLQQQIEWLEQQAAQARKQAIEDAREMQEQEKYQGMEKELLFIIAAMQYRLGHVEKAKQKLLEAKESTYQPKKSMNEQQAAEYDDYLDGLIEEHLALLPSKKSPQKQE